MSASPLSTDGMTSSAGVVSAGDDDDDAAEATSSVVVDAEDEKADDDDDNGGGGECPPPSNEDDEVAVDDRDGGSAGGSARSGSNATGGGSGGGASDDDEDGLEKEANSGGDGAEEAAGEKEDKARLFRQDGKAASSVSSVATEANGGLTVAVVDDGDESDSNRPDGNEASGKGERAEHNRTGIVGGADEDRAGDDGVDNHGAAAEQEEATSTTREETARTLDDDAASSGGAAAAATAIVEGQGEEDGNETRPEILENDADVVSTTDRVVVREREGSVDDDDEDAHDGDAQGRGAVASPNDVGGREVAEKGDARDEDDKEKEATTMNGVASNAEKGDDEDEATTIREEVTLNPVDGTIVAPMAPSIPNALPADAFIVDVFAATTTANAKEERKGSAMTVTSSSSFAATEELPAASIHAGHAMTTTKPEATKSSSVPTVPTTAKRKDETTASSFASAATRTSAADVTMPPSAAFASRATRRSPSRTLADNESRSGNIGVAMASLSLGGNGDNGVPTTPPGLRSFRAPGGGATMSSSIGGSLSSSDGSPSKMTAAPALQEWYKPKNTPPKPLRRGVLPATANTKAVSPPTRNFSPAVVKTTMASSPTRPKRLQEEVSHVPSAQIALRDWNDPWDDGTFAMPTPMAVAKNGSAPHGALDGDGGMASAPNEEGRNGDRLLGRVWRSFRKTCSLVDGRAPPSPVSPCGGRHLRQQSAPPKLGTFLATCAKIDASQPAKIPRGGFLDTCAALDLLSSPPAASAISTTTMPQRAGGRKGLVRIQV